MFSLAALGVLHYHACVYLICVDASEIAINVLKAASLLLFWWNGVLFLCPLPLPFSRNVLRSLENCKTSYTPADVRQTWGRRPGSVLTLENETNDKTLQQRSYPLCWNQTHTGRVFFGLHSLACVSVAGGHLYTHTHTPACVIIARAQDMWGHTGDLTGCHRYDKAEQWLMSDRWTGENDQGMCNISVIIQESTVWLDTYC